MKSRDTRNLPLPPGGREANDALINFTSDRSVAVLMRSDVGGTFVGSSTCVRIGNHFLLATAGHNLQGDTSADSLRLLPRGVRAHPGIPCIAKSQHRDLNKEADVAWIELEESVVADTGLRFLMIEDLLPAAPLVEPQAVFIQGFPAAELEVHTEADVDPLSLGLLTTRLPSGTAEIVAEYPPNSPEDAGLELVAPHGVSGGGVWFVPRFEDHLIWSPEKVQLTGITRSWDRAKKILFAERIQEWLRLVATDFPDIEAAILTRLADA